MTLYKFNKLETSEKISTIIACGALVDSRTEEDFRILLYQIDAFYVEVYYHSAHNAIRKITSFKATSHLKPYLERIDISELVK